MYPSEPGRKSFRLCLAGITQREIGAPRMLAGSRPGGFAVTHDIDAKILLFDA